MVVDTPGGRFRVDYDAGLPISPVGPLVFFAQFLEASGRFEALCAKAALTYTSPNAPDKRAVLATMVLGIHAGGRRRRPVGVRADDPKFRSRPGGCRA